MTAVTLVTDRSRPILLWFSVGFLMDEVLALVNGRTLGQFIEMEKTLGVADLGIKLKIQSVLALSSWRNYEISIGDAAGNECSSGF